MKLLLSFLIAFKVLSVPAVEIDGRDFISFKTILKKFHFRAIKGEYGFIGDGHRLVIYPKTGIYLLDDERGRLDFLKRKGDIYLSGELWAIVLSKFLESNIYWDYEKDRFILSSYPPSIKRVEVIRTGDSLILRVKLNPDLEYELEEREFLVLKVKRGFFRGPYRYEGDHVVLDSVYITHTSAGAEFRIYKGNSTHHVEKKGGILDVVFKKKLKPSKGIERRIDCIVIDPGHGGKDPGAIGRRGTREKDIVLMIAKKVREILERRTGLRVYLTRDRDKFVPLRERTMYANRMGADIFVSIHCNYSKRRSAEGIETYFLSEAKTQWERAVAAFENSAIKYEVENNVDTSDIIKYILMDMAQTEYLKESQDLAAYIQESIVKRTRRIDRGVKQAGFYVLAGAYMPAVLVEVSFISNPTEEKLLRSKRYQEKIAKGIADGIEKFIRAYSR